MEIPEMLLEILILSGGIGIGYAPKSQQNLAEAPIPEGESSLIAYVSNKATSPCYAPRSERVDLLLLYIYWPRRPRTHDASGSNHTKYSKRQKSLGHEVPPPTRTDHDTGHSYPFLVVDVCLPEPYKFE